MKEVKKKFFKEYELRSNKNMIIIMKNRFQNEYINFIFFLIINIIFSFIISLVLTDGLYDGLIFVLFQLFFLLLPGRILLELVHFDDDYNGLKIVTKSYFMGYIFNVFCYLLIVPFGLQSYTNIVLIAMLMLLFVALKLKKSFRQENILKISRTGRSAFITVSFVLVLILVLQMITYVGANMMPPVINENFLENDVLYWIGNIIELTKNFPPKDFRNYPNSYNYHYFSSLQLALVSLSTGIRASILGFGFSVIQSTFMCVMGAWILIEEVVKKPLYQAIGLLAVFFASGIENITITTYHAHLFWGGFGFDYGLAWFCLFWAMLYKLCQSDSLKIKNIVWIWTIIFVMCGTKASFAAIALVGLGVVCFCWLIKGKWKTALWLGVPPVIIFIFAYLFITNIKGYGGNIANVIHFMPLYEVYEVLGKIRNLIDRIIPFGKIIPEILFNLGYLILCNPFAFGLMLYVLLFKKKKFNAFEYGMLFSVLIGAFINMYMYMYGTSNMYFIMAVYPIAIIIGLKYFELDLKFIRGKIEFVLVIVLLLISILGWGRGCNYWNVKNGLVKGWGNIAYQKQLIEAKGAYITTEHYEACEYIRKNKNEETVITTNMVQEFVTGVFTEAYNVDCGLNLSKEDVSKNDLIARIKDKNVEYIIRAKNRPWDMDKVESFISCYENEGFIIYRVDRDKL